MQKPIKQNFILTVLSLFSFILVWAFLLGLPVSQALASYEISDGSVKGLWHQNGDSVDASGNGHGGTDTSVTYSTAKLSTGAVYTGSPSKTVVGGTQFSDANGSLAFWAKWTGTTPRYFFSEGSATSHRFVCGSGIIAGYGLECDIDGTVQFHTTNYNDNNWHYFVVTMNGSGSKVYVDGSQVTPTYDAGTSTTTAWTSHYAFTNTGIGFLNYNSNSYYDSGSMDEMVYLNKDLSASVVTALYNSGTGQEICTTAGCAATTSTSTVLSTSTDCFLGTDTTDWELLKNIVLWIFYFMFTVIIVSLFWKWISKFKKFTK